MTLNTQVLNVIPMFLCVTQVMMSLYSRAVKIWTFFTLGFPDNSPFSYRLSKGNNRLDTPNVWTDDDSRAPYKLRSLKEICTSCTKKQVQSKTLQPSRKPMQA